MLNDTSFTALTGGGSMGKSEHPLRPNVRTSVSVKKTEVSANSDSSYSDHSEKNMADPDKQPLHNKPHPLRKCRGFRSKTLDERKAYLKEKNICYRCCASTSHLAKDCEKNVQCRECWSERHPTALHGSAPWMTEVSVTTRDQGGEQEEGAAQTVTSKCTDICGPTVRGRSCSKICLVSVYPAGQRERAVKAYAVLDEHSNKSLARMEFFELFTLQRAQRHTL